MVFVDRIETGQVEFSEKTYVKVYFSGCDFRCPWCNTPELIENKLEQDIDEREVIKEINSLNLKDVLLTGGEPCFQKQPLLRIAKSLSDKKIVLDTNGSKPDVIENLMKEELLDTVIMDIKAPGENFDKVTKSSTWFKTTEDIQKDVKQTIAILKSYDDKEIIFRTTIVPGYIFREEHILEIAEMIKDINCVWMIRPFSPIGVHKKMAEVNSPTDKFLRNMKEKVIKEYPKLRVS